MMGLDLLYLHGLLCGQLVKPISAVPALQRIERTNRRGGRCSGGAAAQLYHFNT